MNYKFMLNLLLWAFVFCNSYGACQEISNVGSSGADLLITASSSESITETEEITEIASESIVEAVTVIDSENVITLETASDSERVEEADVAKDELAVPEWISTFVTALTYIIKATECDYTLVELKSPSIAVLNEIKDLNPVFEFNFSRTMMDFQNYCATITPGIIKEQFWSNDNRTLTVVPETLNIGTSYELTIATSTLNIDGFPLKTASVICFSTYYPEPASVTMVTPKDNSLEVSPESTIILYFSKEIIWEDASPASFSVYNESAMHEVSLRPVALSANHKTLALIPENDLEIESIYSVNILSGIKTYVDDMEEGQPEVATATFIFSTK